MLELTQIIDDLIALRETKTKYQRDFDGISGLNYAQINRIETGKNKTGPPVDVFTKWLKACDSSPAEYFGYHAMVDRLMSNVNDEELEKLLRLALILPSKKILLKQFLEQLLKDETVAAVKRANKPAAKKKKEASSG